MSIEDGLLDEIDALRVEIERLLAALEGIAEGMWNPATDHFRIVSDMRHIAKSALGAIDQQSGKMEK